MLFKSYACVHIVVLLSLCIHSKAQDIPESLLNAWQDKVNERFHVSPAPPQRSDPGEPLFLSPYIKEGRSSNARNDSSVDTEHMIDGIRSHSGYITVDETYNSNTWFWYFPVEGHEESETPLVLWLQGGPGASSLFGLFEELGPFSVDPDGEHLIENPNSWHKKYNLLFIDNPVGTGYSFTDPEGYATNQTQIGMQLYSFMTQFLSLFPELQQVPFFISGESYAGKHIPSLAYQIHKNNPTAPLKINLQGLAIGNGFIDPASMMDYSSFVYQAGLVDSKVASRMKVFELSCDAALAANDWELAFKFFGATLGTFIQEAKSISVYNYVYEESGSSLYGPFTRFIQRPEVKKALHVGSNKFGELRTVYSKLIGDFMTSAKPWLEELLEHYRIMSYSGQMDVICAYPLSARTFRNLQWSGSADYRDAERKPWYLSKTLAGYVKKAGNFQEVMVRNAGHMVPTDQPVRSLQLLEAFISNQPLSEEPHD